MTDSLLTQREVAQMLDVSERTLEGWRTRGRVRAELPFIKLGPGKRGAVRYRRSDVEAYIEACARRSTSGAL